MRLPKHLLAVQVLTKSFRPAIAQLAEHLTVEMLQTSDRPWFDSGWPDSSMLGGAFHVCATKGVPACLVWRTILL